MQVNQTDRRQPRSKGTREAQVGNDRHRDPDAPMALLTMVLPGELPLEPWLDWLERAR